MPLVSRLCPLCGRCPPGANRALLRAPVTLGLGRVSAYGQRAGKAGRVGAGGRVPTPPCPGPPRNAPNGPEPQPCGQSPPHEDPALAPLLHPTRLLAPRRAFCCRLPNKPRARTPPPRGPFWGTPAHHTLQTRRHIWTRGRARSRRGKGRVPGSPVCDQLSCTAQPRPGPGFPRHCFCQDPGGVLLLDLRDLRAQTASFPSLDTGPSPR